MNCLPHTEYIAKGLLNSPKSEPLSVSRISSSGHTSTKCVENVSGSAQVDFASSIIISGVVKIPKMKLGLIVQWAMSPAQVQVLAPPKAVVFDFSVLTSNFIA